MSGRIEILYFAGLREQLALEHESFELADNIDNMADLLNALRARGERWCDVLAADRPLMMAVNQQMSTPGTAIKAGDEVALFPPVTGG